MKKLMFCLTALTVAASASAQTKWDLPTGYSANSFQTQNVQQFATEVDQLTGGNRAKTDSVAAPFHLLRRVANPEEVASAVLFLCSGEAVFITGTDIRVDGGYTAMGPERAEPAIPLLMS